MKSRIPFSGKGAKTRQKHGPFPPSETEKKKNILDLTRRGKSNDIAHRPIIQVFTVFVEMARYTIKALSDEKKPMLAWLKGLKECQESSQNLKDCRPRPRDKSRDESYDEI